MIRLNSRQQAAVDFTTGIAGVIAVPGSGKTTTMTRRIAKLVKDHGVAPETILGLTFTRNAAQAMRTKLKPVLEEKAGRVTLSTIHSFCHTLLKNEGKVFEILNGNDQLRFIRKIMGKSRIKNIPAGMVVREIGLAKNNRISVTEFAAMYEGDDTLSDIAKVFEKYEQEKQKKLLMDFNDLLIDASRLLKDKTGDKYRSLYRHILVDEYQDLNPAQVHLLKLLMSNDDKSSFWMCGDDWQSIYAFAGASPGNILNFQKMFPKSKQFILDKNYRSTPQILQVCQRLIDKNTKKIKKTLKTDNGKGDAVVVFDAVNEEDEALTIVNEIIALVESGQYLYRDIAVLYRANSQSRVIEEAFSQHKIPYRIENGMNFYQRHEVKTLIDYLRLIDEPGSNEALKSVINVPNRYIGRSFMTDLTAFADQNHLNLYEALKVMPVKPAYLKKNVREFIRLLEPLMNMKNRPEPSELIHLLREGLDYDRFIADDDVPGPDDSKIANINQLQLAANRYRDIESFIRYTESFRDEMSNDKNGVSLMTIHKSKGLEFPVVFVTGFMEGILPNKNGDIEEERRIAFTGLSRAMKRLCLTYSHTYMGKHIKRSAFLDEAL